MKHKPALKVLAAAFAGCIGLACPAMPATAGLLSATGAVIAILNGELFVGEAEGHIGGEGTLEIHSRKDPSLSCRGDFTSSAKLGGGSGQLRCSDGSSATFQFRRLSVFRGHGTGTHSSGTMTFAYGLEAAEAAPYLRLPDGKKLRQDGVKLALVDL
jgi:hypothetical protein